MLKVVSEFQLALATLDARNQEPFSKCSVILDTDTHLMSGSFSPNNWLFWFIFTLCYLKLYLA